jgi:BlaI family transcriptional regulator, penicillinase repressor
MSGSAAVPLTPAEWKVMKVVWRLRACAARDVYEQTAKTYGWAPSTAKSVLRRLVDKGCLTTTQVGNSFLYKPAESVVQSLLGAADELLDSVLDGTTGLVFSHLVKNSQLTERELTDLRAMLDAQSTREE